MRRLGDPAQPRHVPISLAEYVRHVLLLSHQRFAWHREFLLTYFDIISKKDALRIMGVYCKGRLDILANISPAALQVNTIMHAARDVTCTLYNTR
jgi:hypothetical protein